MTLIDWKVHKNRENKKWGGCPEKVSMLLFASFRLTPITLSPILSKVSRDECNFWWNMLHNQCTAIDFLSSFTSHQFLKRKRKRIDLFEIWNSAILRYNIYEKRKKKGGGGLRKDCSNQHLLGVRCFDDVPINQAFLFLTPSPSNSFPFETQKKDRDIFLHENET